MSLTFIKLNLLNIKIKLLFPCQPIISDEFVDSHKAKVLITLEEQRIGPELRLQDFDEYIDLVNGNTQESVDRFLAEPHDFDGNIVF